MWNDDTRGALVGALILFLVVLTALMFSMLNGAPMPHIGPPNLCTEADGGGVGCFRNWITTVAGALTVGALIFAGFQVREANRQSDAAVRNSLERILADVTDEHENARKTHQLIDGLSSRAFSYLQKAQVFREPEVEGLRGLIEKFDREGLRACRAAISSRYGLELTEENRLREGAMEEIDAVLRAHLRAAKRAKGMKKRIVGYMGQPPFLNAQQEAAFYELINILTSVSMAESKDNGVVGYGTRIGQNRIMIVDAISDLDRDVMRRARIVHQRNTPRYNKHRERLREEKMRQLQDAERETQTNPEDEGSPKP